MICVPKGHRACFSCALASASALVRSCQIAGREAHPWPVPSGEGKRDPAQTLLPTRAPADDSGIHRGLSLAYACPCSAFIASSRARCHRHHIPLCVGSENPLDAETPALLGLSTPLLLCPAEPCSLSTRCPMAGLTAHLEAICSATDTGRKA